MIASSITVNDFALALAQSPDVLLIDVRRPDEYTERHVNGARLFPLENLDPSAVAASLKLQEASIFFILCKSGTRARKAAERFYAAGVLNGCVVEGGTDGCAAAGIPCEGTGV